MFIIKAFKIYYIKFCISIKDSRNTNLNLKSFKDWLLGTFIQRTNYFKYNFKKLAKLVK